MAQITGFRSVCLVHVKDTQQHVPAAGVSAKRIHTIDRRHALFSSVLGFAACLAPLEVSAIPLAPLGKRTDKVGGDKLQMPTVDQVKARSTSCDFYSAEPHSLRKSSAAGCFEKGSC